MTHSQTDVARRVILFGSETGFSRPLLERLLPERVQVQAVVLAAPPHADNRFPVSLDRASPASGLSSLAATHNIPCYRTHSLNDPQLQQQLNACRPEFGLVACFSMKLPAALIQLPRLACWNLHPSLLPAYRGPTPLYWQIHHQETHTGLTLHELSDRYDAGNIVAQQRLPLPEQCDPTALDNWVAKFGAALFLQTMNDCLHNRLTPLPQDESLASYYPRPNSALPLSLQPSPGGTRQR